MKIKIHKGTNEIGGSCIELKTKNTTILLDYGTPLQDTSEQVKITDNIDAILISHPHQDHFGEIVNIENITPIYCGELSVELMNAAKIFTGNEILENNFQIFEAWKSFEIGDFKITPYLVDHSATDAYAFLIEADGKKVLYSGDFRANGRKSKLFDRMIKDKNLKNVDILLMEGTMLQRSNKDFPDEQSVEDKILETIKENNQISFMIGSSQNIDSLVSAYRACKKANKIFVVDMYTAWILEKIKIISSSIPNIDWGDVKVIKKFGGSYYQKLQENKEYFKGFTSKVFDNVVEIDDIKANPQNYFLKISPWHIQKVLYYIEVDTSNIIYSQWLGYLKEEFSNIDTVELFKNLQENNNWVYAHTSGHADLPALQKFASSLKPKKLIPIHTEFKDKFAEYFENVMILEDGESFDINDKLSIHQVNELNQLFKDDFYEDKEEVIEEWIGIDLDGTLAYYDGAWRGIEHIGEPIKPMIEFVKDLVSQGKKIKIFTARAKNRDTIPYIHKWLKENDLPEFEVTNEKDFGMIMLYDDRCSQVVTNTGEIIKKIGKLK
jgi:ribonuclease J